MKRIFWGIGVKLFILSVVLTSIFALSACGNNKGTSIDKEKIDNLTLPNEKDNYVNLTLYFDDSKDGKKEAVAEEERLINKEELLGELIVQQLIKGPSIKSELSPVFPKETRLLSFSIKDNIAVINLSKEAKIAMTNIKEKACLVCISKSLTQLPSVEKVQILIENKNVESLGGNYNISQPFNENTIEEVKRN